MMPFAVPGPLLYGDFSRGLHVLSRLSILHVVFYC
jgi:hypothetical protein